MSNKVRRIFSKAVNLITSATAQGLSKGELGSPDTPEEMKSIARIAAEEGIVMLKNNGVLPIEKDENVCIFGRIQRDYFFVGYGSGHHSGHGKRTGQRHQSYEQGKEIHVSRRQILEI